MTHDVEDLLQELAITQQALADANQEIEHLRRQYESTPERAFKAVMGNFDIQIEGSGRSCYPIELSIMNGPNCIAEISHAYPILTAEDIEA